VGPLVVSPEAAVLLAVSDALDDPVMLAVSEAAAEDVPAGKGFAEVEAVSDDRTSAFYPVLERRTRLLLWPSPWRRCIIASMFRTDFGQGHADAADVTRRKVARVRGRIVNF
jgi:hypothetical protein